MFNQVKIVIPAAGAGQRFIVGGYDTPKPFIDIDGQPMINRMLSSLPKNVEKIIVTQEEHKNYVEKFLSDYCVIFTKANTGGAAKTVLELDAYLNNTDPILILDCDQILHIDYEGTLGDMKGYNAGILTFQVKNSDPKYGYVSGFPVVKKTAEKQPISQYATAGFYYFANWGIYKDAAYNMINAACTINNEYYISPVFNYLKGPARNVVINDNQIVSWGTPAELQDYIQKNKH
jgi:NDP-sugar pyrophosphorylase family protein